MDKIKVLIVDDETLLLDRYGRECYNGGRKLYILNKEKTT